MAKKKLQIQLQLSELIYDIENKAFLRGRHAQVPDMQMSSDMQIDELSENRNQVLRSLDSAIQEAKVTMWEWFQAPLIVIAKPDTSIIGNEATTTTHDVEGSGEIATTDGTALMAQAVSLPPLSNILTTGLSFVQIDLYLPSNYNSYVQDTLTASLHDYIVYKALSDYSLVTDKVDMEMYLAKANIALQTLSTSIHKRLRPQRIADTKPIDDING